MLSKEDNEYLTRVGAGTPMGELFRRFWLPALLSIELPAPDAPPVRIRLLGEDLVGFRDTNGRVGILEAFALTSWAISSGHATRSPACAVPIMAGSMT